MLGDFSESSPANPSDFVCGKFVCGGKKLESSPVWAMSVLRAGDMRIFPDGENKNRTNFFAELFGSARKVAAPQLVHSRTVEFISDAAEISGKKIDGVITRNKNLAPSVTVADCMPIFLFDRNSLSFGTLHSGWKGTGIAENAVRLLQKKFGSRGEDFCFVFGAHIKSECYEIDDERAEYFRRNFGGCVKVSGGKNFLSLTEANLNALKKIGVPRENISVQDECTCCTKIGGDYKFGSFRRQAAFLPGDISMEARKKMFSLQAAVCFFE